MFIKKYILCLCLFSLSFSQLIDNLDINAFKSLAIPGWGEMEISEEKRAKNFFILEACTWLSFLGSHYSNNWYTTFSYSNSISLSEDPREWKNGSYAQTYDFGKVLTVIGM